MMRFGLVYAGLVALASVVGVVPAEAQTREAAFAAGESKECPGCNLSGISFKRRDLAGANLAGANLEVSSFHRANLRGANLSGANLAYANFNRADLTNANLQGANLTEAMLFAADAAAANFT